jgi:hypothetical protein
VSGVANIELSTRPFRVGLEARIAEAGEGVAWLAEAARRLPWPGALLLVAAGLWLLAAGARNRRVIAALGGAAAGAVWALAFRGSLSARLGFPAPTLAGIGAGLAAIVSALFPPAFPLLAGALPGAIVGARVPLGGSATAGVAGGALVGGVIAAVFAELVAAWTAASLGAAAVLGATLSLWSRRPWTGELVAHPFALVAIGAVMAVAGAAFQLGSAWRAGGPRAPGGDLDATRLADRD